MRGRVSLPSNSLEFISIQIPTMKVRGSDLKDFMSLFCTHCLNASSMVSPI
jgi:hypothetical protein